MRLSKFLQATTVRRQLTASWRVILAAYVPTLVVLAIIAIQTQYDIRYLLSDPYIELEIPVLHGIISNLLALLWAGTAAVCFATDLASTGRYRRFFAASGLLTAVLLADDFFMLHEYILDKQFHIPEKVTFAILGLLFLLYSALFYRELLATNYLQLALVAGLLGLSITLDLVIPEEIIIQIVGTPRLLYWPEESLEVLGTVGWCTFYLHTSVNHLRGQLQHATV